MELEIGEIIGAPTTMRDGQTVPVLVRVRREGEPVAERDVAWPAQEQ